MSTLTVDAIQNSGGETPFQPTLATMQASTSGTEIDFTGIPSWVTKVSVMFSGVSTNGTADLKIQLGDAGGIETSGYSGTASRESAVARTNYTDGFLVSDTNAAANVIHGVVELRLMDAATNLWVGFGRIGYSDSANATQTSGSKALSATLDRIRITADGADTFDAGNINIMYE